MELENPYKNKLKPFYVYAKKSEYDSRLFKKLKSHLADLPLEEEDNDVNALPGEVTQEYLIKIFESADIIFLLTSSDFNVSQECLDFEERARDRAIPTIRICLRPLAKRPIHASIINPSLILTLPEHGKFVTDSKSHDHVLKKIAERIWPEVDFLLLSRYIQTAKNQMDKEPDNQARLICHQIDSQVSRNSVLRAEHHSKLYKQIGELYCSLKDFSGADKCYQKACHPDSQNPTLFIAHGDVLSQLERILEACQKYQKASEIVKNLDLESQEKATIYKEIGNAYHKIAEYNEELTIYFEALKICPLDRDLLTKYANTQLTIAVVHQTTGVNRYYDEALNQKPEKPYRYLRDKGTALQDFHLYEDALDAFNEAIDAFNKEEVLDKALTDMEPYKELSYLYKDKGDTLFLLKDFLEAFKIYEKAVSLQPDFLAAIEKKDEILKTIEQQRNELSLHLEKYQR